MTIDGAFSQKNENLGGQTNEFEVLLNMSRFFVQRLQILANKDTTFLPQRVEDSTSDYTRLPSKAALLQAARKAYDMRRRREQIFSQNDLFGEPAWDILLDLYIQGEVSKKISVTSACVGSYVPATTALRWLKELENVGLLIRDIDTRDGRRTFVRLSPKGVELMEKYLRCSL